MRNQLFRLAGACLLLCIFVSLASLSFASDELPAPAEYKEVNYWVSIYADKPSYLPNETVELRISAYPSLPSGEFVTLSISKEINSKWVVIEVKQVSMEAVRLDEYSTETSVNMTFASGKYLITASTSLANYDSSVQFEVSELGLILKTRYDDLQVYAVVLNKSDGKPIAGAEVNFYYLEKSGNEGDSVEAYEKKPLASVQSGEDGIVGVLLPQAAFGESVTAEAVYGDERITTDLYFYKNIWNSNLRAYTYSDRPIYRPGQTVHFRGIVWKDLGDEKYSGASGEYTLELYDSNYKIIETKKVNAESDGIIYADFNLGNEAALGWYYIYVYQGDKEAAYWGISSYSFQVEEYQKPEYKIEISRESKWYQAGESANIGVSVNYYFGKPVANASVKWKLREEVPYYVCGGWRCPVYDYYYDDYIGRRQTGGDILIEG
ncbi:MAG: MG2 domain-containing protein, partial [Candidatus Micrarchaeota archaeon]